MKHIVICITLLLFTTSCLSSGTTALEDQLALSIGRVILVHDEVWSYQSESYKTGGFAISKIIDKEYEDKISKMPIKYRIDYFWAIMMHISLDGSFFEDFMLLVKKDCNKEFVDHIDQFLKKSKELRIYGKDQIKVEKIRLLLVNI